MNIYESITKIMEEVPAITKSDKNETQKFMYRGIDKVMNAMQPLLAKYKVFVVPECLERNREERTTSKGGNLIYSILKMKYKFCAEDGSFVEAITIGEGMDSGDKASNKAMAIAMKYAMFQVFCIPTDAEDDPDKTTPEPSKPSANGTTKTKTAAEDKKATASQLKILAGKYTGDNLKKLLEMNNVEKLEDLTLKKASELITKLAQAKKKEEVKENE